MRRFVANALLLVMLGIFLAPAMSAAVPQPIPACCRRGGAHHCAMMAALMFQQDGKAVRCDNPCPMRQAPQLGTSIVALLVSRETKVELRAQLLGSKTFFAPYFSLVRSDHERGPPSIPLA